MRSEGKVVEIFTGCREGPLGDDRASAGLSGPGCGGQDGC